METKIVNNDDLMNDIRGIISEGASVTLRCKGNSMNPFLVSGRDSLVLSPFSDSDIVPGAAVLGREVHGVYLMHRIVEVHEDYVLLNGDGNWQDSREKVMKSEIIALLSGYVRKEKEGSVNSKAWRTYSTFWRIAASVRIGKLSLRRVVLSIWRRTHKDLILDTRPYRNNIQR